MRSTGLVLAAGGIAAANEILFKPNSDGPVLDKQGNLDTFKNFNWRLLPATGVLALALGGLEKVSEPLAVGFAGLIVLAVLIIPVGHAPTPIDNVVKTLGL